MNFAENLTDTREYHVDEDNYSDTWISSGKRPVSKVIMSIYLMYAFHISGLFSLVSKSTVLILIMIVQQLACCNVCPLLNPVPYRCQIFT